MNSNILSTLMYSGMPIVVTIISAVIMRVKRDYWVKFDIGDAFLGMLLGVVWPITVFGWVVYFVSGFLFCKIYKKDN